MSENLDQLRRDLAAAAPDSPEHARILDRIAVLVREAAVARRQARVSARLYLPTVRILGVVDELGYLWCTDCKNVTDYDHGYVWSDQAAHVDERCDGCQRTLRNRRTVLAEYPIAGYVEIPVRELDLGDVIDLGNCGRRRVESQPVNYLGYMRFETTAPDRGNARGRWMIRNDLRARVCNLRAN